MKKSVYLFSMLLFLLAMATGCSDRGEEPELNFLELESANVSFDAYGGAGDIVVKTTAGITVSSAATWCTAAVSGNKVAVTVPANGGLLGRSTVVTLISAGKKVQVPVTQAGLEFKLESNTVALPLRTAKDTTLWLHCSMPVTAQSSATWLSVNLTADNTTLELHAETNSDPPRTATVTLTTGDLTVAITVTQKGVVPLNVFFATMSTYGYLDDTKSSSSVNTLINQCNSLLYSTYYEQLVYIVVGDSPFGASAPGRGFVFGSYDGSQVWNVQFVFNFTVSGNNLAITYASAGFNASYYTTQFTAFRNAITNKSPYSLTADDLDNPTEITLTSVADPDFYFVVNDFE